MEESNNADLSQSPEQKDKKIPDSENKDLNDKTENIFDSESKTHTKKKKKKKRKSIDEGSESKKKKQLI